MLIVGLDNLDDERTKKIAQDWAQRWVQSNYIAYKETGAMFEKVSVDCDVFKTLVFNLFFDFQYLATELGGHGGGGEYEVQRGFGWSNGAVLDLLDRYGSTLTSGSGANSDHKN